MIRTKVIFLTLPRIALLQKETAVMERVNEEQIELNPPQNGHVNQAVIPIRSHQRSLSFRNHGMRTLRAKKVIKSFTPFGSEPAEKKDLQESLGNAIKTGDIFQIQELVTAHGVSTINNLRFAVSIRVKMKRGGRYLEIGRYKPSERQTATMEVTPLQLAVVFKKANIVQLMLEWATRTQDKDETRSMLDAMIGQARATVKFEEDLVKYRDVDRMLDGSTAFDLAARFCVQSLQLLIDHIKEHGKINDYIVTNRESGFSALHYAACNADTDCLR